MAQDSPAPSTRRDVLADRRDAHTIAAAVGCDVRTALRAIRDGIDVIKTHRLREEMRPHVERLMAARSDDGSSGRAA